MTEQSKEALAFTSSVLQMVFETEDEPLLFERFIDLVKAYTGSFAVGIRLLKSDGLISYVAQKGFSTDFLEQENNLSLVDDECMCISVVRGDVAHSAPFFTDGGSFYVNGTTKFLATVTEEEKGKTRNACNRAGYESVALIPMRLDKEIIGLVQLVSKESEKFPISIVKVLESAALALASAHQRILATKALKHEREKLRALSSRLAEVEERERKQIAEDLHDNVGQYLAVAKMKAQRGGASEVVDLLDKAIAQTRQLTSELMSPVLYELGLAAALEQLVEDKRKLLDTNISLSLSGDFSPIPLNMAIVLFKAVRELLVNVGKHAKANTVGLSLVMEPTRLVVTVIDDGVGLRENSKEGFGLFNIRERVMSIGGEVTINSCAQKGTCVELIVPNRWSESP